MIFIKGGRFRVSGFGWVLGLGFSVLGFWCEPGFSFSNGESVKIAGGRVADPNSPNGSRFKT
jgi:hypothetical protein